MKKENNIMKRISSALKLSYVIIHESGMIPLYIIIVGYFIFECLLNAFLWISSHSCETTLTLNYSLNNFHVILVGSFLVLYLINNQLSGNKFSYSVSLAKEIHTIVCVIYTFSFIFISNIIYIISVLIEYDKKCLPSLILFSAVQGVCFLVFYTIAKGGNWVIVINIVLLLSIIIDRIEIVISLPYLDLSLPAAVILSLTIYAAGFAVSCWYLNRLWDKKERFKKQKKLVPVSY